MVNQHHCEKEKCHASACDLNGLWRFGLWRFGAIIILSNIAAPRHSNKQAQHDSGA
jgi:hypothetical protein